MSCDKPKGYLVAECEHGGMAYIPLGCRRCESCRLYWYARSVERIEQHLAEERWVTFLHLTSVPGSTWKGLTYALGELVDWLRRRGIRDYVAVRELGPDNGMKHFHIILTGWLWVPKPDVVRKWYTLTGAYIIKMRRVPVSSKPRSMCARYVAKYVGKGLKSLPVGELPRKLLSFSRGWSKLLRLPSGWEVSYEAKLDFKAVAVWSRSGCGLLGHRPLCADCFGGLHKSHQNGTISDKALVGFQ